MREHTKDYLGMRYTKKVENTVNLALHEQDATIETNVLYNHLIILIYDEYTDYIILLFSDVKTLF